MRFRLRPRAPPVAEIDPVGARYHPRMCGRYSLSVPASVLVELFNARLDADLRPRFNIAPMQLAPVVRMAAGERRIQSLKWGLVPAWADDPKIGNSLINARAESAPAKPAFRAAFKRQRCLVPADGFYEWQQTPEGKQPFRIRRKDGQPLAFAGLWEHWTGRTSKDVDVAARTAPLETFTILTTEPNELLRSIHNRMPVIVNAADFEKWLDPGSDPKSLETILHPIAADALEAYPVSRRVNKPSHDEPDCIEPLVAEPPFGKPKEEPGLLF